MALFLQHFKGIFSYSFCYDFGSDQLENIKVLKAENLEVPIGSEFFEMIKKMVNLEDLEIYNKEDSMKLTVNSSIIQDFPDTIKDFGLSFCKIERFDNDYEENCKFAESMTALAAKSEFDIDCFSGIKIMDKNVTEFHQQCENVKTRTLATSLTLAFLLVTCLSSFLTWKYVIEPNKYRIYNIPCLERFFKENREDKEIDVFLINNLDYDCMLTDTKEMKALMKKLTNEQNDQSRRYTVRNNADINHTMNWEEEVKQLASSAKRTIVLVTEEGFGSTLTNEAFEVLSNVDRKR